MASFKYNHVSLLALASIFLFITSSTGFDFNLGTEQKTHLHFFFHEIGEGPERTSFIVAGPNMTSYVPQDVTVYDDTMRETADPNSKLIGRVQGIAALADMADMSATTAENFVFTEGEFKGSTLTMVGRLPMADPIAERPIVGGTGKFRLARGFGITKIVDVSNGGFIVEFDIYVLHYGTNGFELPTYVADS
ncbi:hypothetical protein LUZ60_015935 [Juncus effusus]|nr:hypothetical protein LUZ60_015935 [Juncus effusus]